MRAVGDLEQQAREISFATVTPSLVMRGAP